LKKLSRHREKDGKSARFCTHFSSAALRRSIVYPLYRTQYRQALSLTVWNTFAMAWKMQLAWLAPMLATAVTYVVIHYGAQVAREARIRQALEELFTAAFAAAGVNGLLGAFVTKVLPVHYASALPANGAVERRIGYCLSRRWIIQSFLLSAWRCSPN
jgi:hypothetical protein